MLERTLDSLSTPYRPVPRETCQRIHGVIRMAEPHGSFFGALVPTPIR